MKNIPRTFDHSAEYFHTKRRWMIHEQIVARGIDDRRLLEAIEAVPREAFVSPDLASEAYEDRPLPIGFGHPSLTKALLNERKK